MSKEYEIDFINCTEKECIQFCKKLNNDEMDKNKIIKTFDYFKNRENYTREEAIKLIYNVVLATHVIDYCRTNYKTYCGRLLLTVAKFVNKYESANYNIVYALYVSQLNDDFTDFKDSARREIIEEVCNRFYCLVNDDVEKAESLNRNFKDLINLNFNKYALKSSWDKNDY